MRPAKRVVAAAKKVLGPLLDFGLLWLLAVYIRFWFDLCHLISQTTAHNQITLTHTRTHTRRLPTMEFIQLHASWTNSVPGPKYI